MKKLLLFVFVFAAFLVLTPLSKAELVKKSDGDHVVIQIKKGWNLIPLYISHFSDSSSAISGWPNDSIGVAYVLDPIIKSYIKITDLTDSNKLFDRETGPYGKYNDENKNTLTNAQNLLTNVAFSGMWVYSKGEFSIDRQVNLNLSEYFGALGKGYGGVQLYKGWNFFSTAPDLSGKSFVGIKGNCEINKAVFWDNSQQNWHEQRLDQVEFSDQDAGLVIALKVANTCKLSGSGNATGGAPPAIPN